MVFECIEDFFLDGLLFKKEIGVYLFFMKYLNYDGRRVFIVIFDMGVDLGVFGL